MYKIISDCALSPEGYGWQFQFANFGKENEMPEFLTSDGLKLHYSDHGAGHVILCLPGLTRNHHDFEEFIASNRLGARVVALTFRGRWPSEYDGNWQNYSAFIEAQDTLALMRHLDIPKAMIIGTSRGGIVAMIMAMLAKEAIGGVVFNDIGPEIDPRGLARISDYLGVKPHWKNAHEAASALMALNLSAFPDYTLEIWEKLARRWYHFDHEGTELKYDPALKTAFDNTPKDFDLWPAFDALEGLPIGAIWGMNSDLLTEEILNKMQERRADMAVAKLEKCGHVPLLNEAKSLSLIEGVFAKAFSL